MCDEPGQTILCKRETPDSPHRRLCLLRCEMKTRQAANRRPSGPERAGEARVSDLIPIDDATREHLRAASTATIATQLFRLGLRNQFLNGLLPANAEHCRFVGEAATLRSIPMRGDLDVLEAFRDPKHPQRKAVETARAGTVLVMDCRGETRGVGGQYPGDAVTGAG